MKFLQHYSRGKSENLMRHEGDLINARKIYVAGQNKNLMFLLRTRFSWMNLFIEKEMFGLELGSGIAASKDFIDSKNFLTTDFNDSDWLDIKNVDALSTSFKNNSQDFIIASNMIHHLAKPKVFFVEVDRILKPGGLLLIQEVHTSFFMRFILRLMKHEAYDERIDVFDNDIVCNDANDPWSANCSIPKLLFCKEFSRKYSGWKIIFDKKVEFFSFLNSGGVTAKTIYLPLPKAMLQLCYYLDCLITKMFPEIFALQRQVVIQKSIE